MNMEAGVFMAQTTFGASNSLEELFWCVCEALYAIVSIGNICVIQKRLLLKN